MVKSIVSLAVPLLMTAKLVAGSCASISYTTCDDNIVHWYHPGTGEVCDPLPCGGGRAPLRTDVPGCDAYKGTEIYHPTTSYLSCFTPAGALLEPTAVITEASDAPTTTAEAEESSVEESQDPSPSPDIPTTTSTMETTASETTNPSVITTTASESTFVTTSIASTSTSTNASTPAPSTTPASSSTPVESAGETEPTSAGSRLGSSFGAVLALAIGVTALL